VKGRAAGKHGLPRLSGRAKGKKKSKNLSRHRAETYYQVKYFVYS